MELLCLSTPVEIVPGEVFTDTLDVRGYGYGGGISPQFSTPNPEGVYRLAWRRARFDPGPGDGSPHPDHYPVSNTFRLQLP